MTTTKSDWLHSHDGCVMARCHHDDDRFSWTGLGMQCVANVMCALMYYTIMHPDICLTQHRDNKLSNGDTLYQQIRKIGKLLASIYQHKCVCTINSW